MTTPAKLTREQIEWYRTHIVHRAQGGLLSDDGITSLCDLAIAGLDADRLAEALQRVKHSLADGRGYAGHDDDNLLGWLCDSLVAIGQAESALAAYQAGKEKP